MIPACDGRTDGRIDGATYAKWRSSVPEHDKKKTRCHDFARC